MEKIEYTVLEDGIVQYRDGDKLVSIPPHPANSDYQAYLASLEEKPAAKTK